MGFIILSSVSSAADVVWAILILLMAVVLSFWLSSFIVMDFCIFGCMICSSDGSPLLKMVLNLANFGCDFSFFGFKKLWIVERNWAFIDKGMLFLAWLLSFIFIGVLFIAWVSTCNCDLDAPYVLQLSLVFVGMVWSFWCFGS